MLKHKILINATLKNFHVSLLPDSATLSFLKAIYFSSREDNLQINSIFEFLSLRAIQNIPNIQGYFFWFWSKSRLKFTKSWNLATLCLSLNRENKPANLLLLDLACLIWCHGFWFCYGYLGLDYALPCLVNFVCREMLPEACLRRSK